MGQGLGGAELGCRSRRGESGPVEQLDTCLAVGTGADDTGVAWSPRRAASDSTTELNIGDCGGAEGHQVVDKMDVQGPGRARRRPKATYAAAMPTSVGTSSFLALTNTTAQMSAAVSSIAPQRNATW